jgi:hypothetical protein
MLLSAGVSWTIWGWKCALGVVLAAAVIGSMWLLTGEGLLVLLGLAAAASAGFSEGADQPDPTTLVQYALLVIVVSLLTWNPVPAAAR